MLYRHLNIFQTMLYSHKQRKYQQNLDNSANIEFLAFCNPCAKKILTLLSLCSFISVKNCRKQKNNSKRCCCYKGYKGYKGYTEEFL